MMKKHLGLLLFILMHVIAWSQDKRLIADIDNDNINDTVYVDRDASRIICKLSSQHFQKIQSKTIEMLNEVSGVNVTGNGFEFYNDWMRAGYRNQFRYEAKTKKIRLIGMSRYEFGNATNDGSGESSVNLLTNDYIGDWNYFDYKKEKLIKLPTIKTKMVLDKTYLESFDDEAYFTYGAKCAELYEKQKQLKTKSTH